MNSQVHSIVSRIREITSFKPRAALILGSGLGNFTDHMVIEEEISYTDLDGMPVSTVPGHRGKFIFGTVDGIRTVCMSGRIHFYEGYSTEQIVLPIRVMAALGAEYLFVTNASGGINPDYHIGLPVIINDHISSFIRNPLIGPNDDDEGPRFTDMTEPYDRDLRGLVRSTAQERGIEVGEGVYVQLTGPSFETPAEIRMLKTLGADLVGMSTVMEVIAARHIGMKVCGISLVTNMAAGISKSKLSHEEVFAAGKAAEPVFASLLSGTIGKLV